MGNITNIFTVQTSQQPFPFVLPLPMETIMTFGRHFVCLNLVCLHPLNVYRFGKAI